MAAELITVTRYSIAARVVVDGVEIPPSAILADSISIPVDPGAPPMVTLTLIGAQVDVTNTMKEEVATDGPAE